VVATADLALTPAYSISKAAAFSLTQSLRALLAGRGVRVHAVLTGPVDTEMTRGDREPDATEPARVADSRLGDSRYWLVYSSWRCHQGPVSLRPLGARSSH
jgi:NAD(P)-dependent dehydrogenase (short-subunit alcohol dehydrogenase family)